jgi:hypothetical protein
MPPVLPDSLAALLALLRSSFTGPTFDTFCWLVHGFIGRIGEHTVTGIWQAARLAGVLHHSRAHDFFARRSWSADRLGLALAALIVARFAGAAETIRVAVDDTLFPRCGPKVFAASWLFDPDAKAGTGLRRGNNIVCLGIVIRPQLLRHRPLCLPVLFRLWRPGEDGDEPPSRPELAQELVAVLAARFPQRRLQMLGDAYYANGRLAALPANASAIVRLRKNAVLWEPAPKAQAPRRGRPRKRGARIGSPAEIAADPNTDWRRLAIRGTSGASEAVEASWLDCLWYSALGQRPVRVVICRDPARPDRPALFVLSTDLSPSAAEILSRFLERWSIEVAFQDAKSTLGVGEARNRVRRAVERTIPFGFVCQSITVCWYLLNGDARGDVQRRREAAPWYRQKRTPAFADMLVALRRELIAAEFSPSIGSERPRGEIDRLGLTPLGRVA